MKGLSLSEILEQSFGAALEKTMSLTMFILKISHFFSGRSQVVLSASLAASEASEAGPMKLLQSATTLPASSSSNRGHVFTHNAISVSNLNDFLLLKLNGVLV